MSRSDLNWKCVTSGALTSQDGSNVPVIATGSIPVTGVFAPAPVTAPVPVPVPVPVPNPVPNPVPAPVPLPNYFCNQNAPGLTSGVLAGNVQHPKPNATIFPLVGSVAPSVAPTGANPTAPLGVNPTGINAGELVGNSAVTHAYGSIVPNTLGEFLFYNGNSHLKKIHQIINKVKSIDADKIVATASLLYGNSGAQPKLNEVAGGPAANGIQSLTKEALQYLATICTENSFHMAFLDGSNQGRFLIDKKGNFFVSYIDQVGKLFWQEFSVDGKGLAIQKNHSVFVPKIQLMASGALGVMETRTNIQYEPGIYSAKDPITFLEFQIVDSSGQVLNPSIPQNIHFTPVKFNLNALFPGLTLLTFARTDS